MYVVLCMFICVETICASYDACLSNKFGRRMYCSIKYGKTNMHYHIVFLMKILYLLKLYVPLLRFLAIKGEFSDNAGTHF